MAKKHQVANVVANAANEVTTQDETLNAIAAQDMQAPKDDDNEIVTVTLTNAHKTPTAIILKKGANDSVDGKERWFAKKDLKAFKLEDGKWQVSAPKRYFQNKLVAFTEASN
jgi:S-adenosylhomocysteine hydrolase